MMSASTACPAGRGLQFLLLMVAVFAASYARVSVGPLQEALRIGLGLSDNQIALLQGPALGLPMVIVAIPLGLVIDRYSRVRLLFVFALLMLVGTVLTALASDFALLFAARCLIGLTTIGINPIALSLIADFYLPSERGRATMLMSIGQATGASAVFALGGALLAMSGPAADGWRWAMLWLAGPLFVVVVATLAMREPSRTGSIIKNPSTRQSFSEFWQYRAVIVPLVIGVVLAEVALGAIGWAAPAFSRSFGLSPDRIGTIMAVVMLVAGIVGPSGGGIMADLCQRAGGPRRTMTAVCALALLSIPAALFALVPAVGLASVLLVVFTAIISAICVMGMTLFTIVIPNELRGLCIGVMAAATVLFSFGFAPISVSMLSGAIGGPAMIGKSMSLVCVVSSLLCAVTFGFGRRYFSRTSMA